MPELAKKLINTDFICSLFIRLANNKNTSPYNIKLKKVSGSKDIPQKLWILAPEKKVEIPKIEISKKTEPVILFHLKLNSPEPIIFIIQRINNEKTNTDKSICLFRRNGKFVKGRKNKGKRKTNEYKLYLIILFNIFFI